MMKETRELVRLLLTKALKIINPIENNEEEKMSALESIVEDYYKLVRKSKMEDSNKLNQFSDIDLEQLLAEKEGDVDLNALLDIK